MYDKKKYGEQKANYELRGVILHGSAHFLCKLSGLHEDGSVGGDCCFRQDGLANYGIMEKSTSLQCHDGKLNDWRLPIHRPALALYARVVEASQ